MLADEETGELRWRRPPGREAVVLGSDEDGLDRPRSQLPEETRVLAGVGDHEVGGAEGCAVERQESACGQRAVAEAAAVADERVPEGDEWAEDDRSTVPGSARSPQVQVARIPDEDCVGRRACLEPQPRLRGRQARQGCDVDAPLVLAAVPNGLVPLDYQDKESGTPSDKSVPVRVRRAA